MSPVILPRVTNLLLWSFQYSKISKLHTLKGHIQPPFCWDKSFHKQRDKPSSSILYKCQIYLQPQKKKKKKGLKLCDQLGDPSCRNCHFSGKEWRWTVRKQGLMGKFGAFVECHFAKQLMLLLRHHILILLLIQHLLLCTMLFITISKARFFSLLIDTPISLLPSLFLQWHSLFFLQEERLRLDPPSRSTFLVCPSSIFFFFWLWFLCFCF